MFSYIFKNYAEKTVESLPFTSVARGKRKTSKEMKVEKRGRYDMTLLCAAGKELKRTLMLCVPSFNACPT